MTTAARSVSPPGPRGLDVLRFFGGGSFARTLRYFADVAQRYGPIASFSILGRRLHLVTGPALVRTVLVVEQHAYTRANGAAVLRDLLGTSMLTVDEPVHRRRRRLVQPAFHQHRIARYGEAMIEETQRAIAAWPDGAPVDMGAAMMRLALGIVGRALFGADVRASADALEATLAEAMRTVSWLGPVLEALPPWANELRLRLPLPANGRLASARCKMAAIVERLIASARTRANGADDLLTMLLAASHAGAPLDAQAIADELVTMLLAGHETTANALTWAWYELARNPELAARVRAEVGAIAGTRDITAHDAPALTLTANVFAEALRLYPPASAFGRRALQRCSLGGYTIEAGDGILLSPYVSQRNPAVFARPETFDPDRWAGWSPPPFAYFPFGGGSRLCIGEAFARMEGTLVLATVLQRHTIAPFDAAPIGIGVHATLRPERPVMVRIHRSTGESSRIA